MYIVVCCVLMQVVPDELLPAVTCQAEFVPFFLNLLRDWTAAVWSSSNMSASTPNKAQTPVQEGNHSTHHSCRSADVTPGYMTTSLNSTCTPDSNPRPDSRHTSTHKLSSAKSRRVVLIDVSPQVPSPQEVNSSHHQPKHCPLQQRNSVLHSESFCPSAKERQGRALFIDTSAPSGSYNVRRPARKHKASVGNKIDKVEKTPVPSFNLDSDADFPDMKSSQRYHIISTS